MTEDIDNRLFGKHRYFYSQNLIKSRVSFLDLNKPSDIEFFNNLVKNKSIIYQNDYKDNYTGQKIGFLELYDNTEHNVYYVNQIRND